MLGLFQVVLDTVPARGAGDGAAHTANAMWRIAGGGYRQRGFFGSLHHGQQQGLRTDIQNLLDAHRVVPYRPYYRVAGVGGDGLQLAQHVIQFIGRVFAVDQQPVETGAGQQLGAVGAGQAQPQADLYFAVFQRRLEAVGWVLHGVFLKKQEQLTK